MKILMFSISAAISGLLLFFFNPQEKKKLEPVEYVRWVEDENNGLKASKEIGEFKFTVQFRPLEYIVLKQLEKTSIEKNELETGISEIGDMQYYNLKISLENGMPDILKYKLKNANEYEERVRYFSFDVQNHLKLIEGNDTLNCLLSHFERTYGIAPHLTVLAAFPVNKFSTGTDKSFVFADMIFDCGTIKLKIDQEDIKKIPVLITE